jgi:hypothetical protein
MTSDDDIPGSVRIRCGTNNAYRFDAIQRASRFYDCNRSDAVAYACEDVPGFVDAAQRVLERDDLTEEQREAIAEEFNSATRGVEFELETTVSVSRD